MIEALKEGYKKEEKEDFRKELFEKQSKVVMVEFS